MMFTHLICTLPLLSLISALPHDMNNPHIHNCTNAITARHTHAVHTRGLTDLWVGFSDGCKPDSDGTSVPKHNRTTIPVIANNRDYWQNFEPNESKPYVQVYWGKNRPDPNKKDSINQIVLHRDEDMKGESVTLTWKDDEYKQQKKCYHLADLGIVDNDQGNGWGSMHSNHVDT